jgi:hypothetical protein
MQQAGIEARQDSTGWRKSGACRMKYRSKYDFYPAFGRMLLFFI